MKTRAGALVRELRAEFLPASLLAVFVGTALAFYRTGRWDWTLFAACLAGVGAIHSGANVLNDYFDHLGGTDAINTAYVRPFTGGSRLIQQGRLSPRAVRALGLALLAAGGFIGLLLVAVRGIGVLLFLAPAIAIGLAYSVPRVGLAARGLGEAAVALAFGVLAVTGSYFVQTGRFSAEACFVSLPLAMLVAAVLFINQFQDYYADRATGKRNGVVRLGLRRASHVYAGMLAAGVLLPAVEAAIGVVPAPLAWASLATLLAYPTACHALLYYARPRRLVIANALTVATHALSAILAGGALAIARAAAR